MPKLIPITKKDLPALIPERAQTAHKNQAGRSLIIAGSAGMWGASYLCGEACYRVGSGFVYLSDQTPALFHYPDFLSTLISDKIDLDKFSAIAIGPGLSINKETSQIYQHIFKDFTKPVVIDASALTLVSELKPNWIMTPHEGELARILKISTDEIRADRLHAARIAQDSFGGIIVLKGHNTLIATDHNTYEIHTGNNALAKAGTGDVLTGMITGFLSQGVKPSNAAVLACGLHGYLADRWVKHSDYLSLMASDLLKLLPPALFTLRKKK